MRKHVLRSALKPVIVALTALLVLAATAVAQQAPSTSAEHESKAGPVVRSFGTKDGYRTEVTSETKGTLGQDDLRQVSLLAAQILQHIDQARHALDADDTTRARKEVDKGREALTTVRAMLPRTKVHTRTTAPDGKVMYDDEREVQQERVPLFEGMIQARTFAPIQEAQRDASNIAGVQLIESETISTEVTADLGFVEAQLVRAAKALDEKKPADAAKALLFAQVRGVDFRYNKQDTPLAEARDAIWLAKRALEENNTVQAQANLAIARRHLEVYRQVLPENERKDVDQMMTEVNELAGKLRQEATQPSTRTERTRQGTDVTRWWDQLNGWFKRLR